jgi:hypothetical protein
VALVVVSPWCMIGAFEEGGFNKTVCESSEMVEWASLSDRCTAGWELLDWSESCRCIGDCLRWEGGKDAIICGSRGFGDRIVLFCMMVVDV